MAPKSGIKQVSETIHRAETSYRTHNAGPHTQHQSVTDREECPICNDPYTTATVKLSCGHQFDDACIRIWFRHQAMQDRGLSCPMCRSSQMHTCGHGVHQEDIQDLKFEHLALPCIVCRPLAHACGHHVHEDDFPALDLQTLALPCWACAPTTSMRQYNQREGLHPLSESMSRDSEHHNWARYLWLAAAGYHELSYHGNKAMILLYKDEVIYQIMNALGRQELPAPELERVEGKVAKLWKTYMLVRSHEEGTVWKKKPTPWVQHRWLTDLKETADYIYDFSLED